MSGRVLYRRTRRSFGFGVAWGHQLMRCLSLSTRAIAPVVGVSKKTVHQDLQVLPEVTPAEASAQARSSQPGGHLLWLPCLLLPADGVLRPAALGLGWQATAGGAGGS